MMAWAILASPLAQRVAITLWHFLWQGAAIYVLVAAALRWIAASSPERRYACGVVGLLALVACPVVTYVVLCAEGIPRAAPLAAQEAGRLPSSQRLEMQPASLTEAAAAAHTVPLWQPVVVALWMAGVFVLGARLSLSAIAVRGLRRSGTKPPPWLQAMAQALQQRVGVRRRVAVALSSRVSEALATGVWRPIILLPASWLLSMPHDVLQAVLVHELAHVRRGDLLVVWLERCCETWLFFHPVVWWLGRQLRREREWCCDSLAVQVTGERLRYAQALQWVAEARWSLRPAAVTLPVSGGDQMNLLRRVQRVLGYQPTQPAGRAWPAGLLAVVAPLVVWLATSSGPLLESVMAQAAARAHPAAPRQDTEPASQATEAEKAVEAETVVGRALEYLQAAQDKNADEGGQGTARLKQLRELTLQATRQAQEAERAARQAAAAAGQQDVAANVQELAKMVQDLRREVEQLRAEVHETRGNLHAVPGQPSEPANSDGARPALPAALAELISRYHANTDRAAKQRTVAEARAVEARNMAEAARAEAQQQHAMAEQQRELALKQRDLAEKQANDLRAILESQQQSVEALKRLLNELQPPPSDKRGDDVVPQGARRRGTR